MIGLLPCWGTVARNMVFIVINCQYSGGKKIRIDVPCNSINAIESSDFSPIRERRQNLYTLATWQFSDDIAGICFGVAAQVNSLTWCNINVMVMHGSFSFSLSSVGVLFCVT